MAFVRPVNLSPAELEIALADEINANVDRIQANESRWFWFLNADVSKERALIFRLATQLVDVIQEAFRNLDLTTGNRPLTLPEEKELARMAKRLEKAYTIIGKRDAAKGAALLAKEMELRVDRKDKELGALSERIQKFQEWILIPRDGFVRNLPIVNRFFWTTQGAQVEIAKMQILQAEKGIQDFLLYPECLRPKLEDLLNAKMALAHLQNPTSIEGLATRREIRELTATLQLLVRVLSLPNFIKANTDLLNSREARLTPQQIRNIQEETRQLSAELEARKGELFAALEELKQSK